MTVFYDDFKNCTNSIISTIFQESIEIDSWMNQIQQLSLSKIQKIVVMNSWKQVINNQKIYLNLRSQFYHLYSKIIRDTIQIELSRNIGTLIKLDIIKNDNFLQKTPMENLYNIYIKKLLKLKKNFLCDPNILMIKSFFDIKFNESDIKII